MDPVDKTTAACNTTGRWFVALKFTGDTAGGEPPRRNPVRRFHFRRTRPPDRPRADVGRPLRHRTLACRDRWPPPFPVSTANDLPGAQIQRARFYRLKIESPPDDP